MNEAKTAPTSTTIRKMYSLADAAEMNGCSVESLLQFGAQRRLPILALVPSSVRVFCTNLALIELADPALNELMRRMKISSLDGIRPIVTSDIQLLVLAPADCSRIASHGETYQSVFLTGIAFNEVSAPIFVEPPALAASPGYIDMRPSRRFACYSAGHDPYANGVPTRTVPTKIALTADMLRVVGDDLTALEISSIECVRMSRFDNGFRRESYMSARLIYLNEGALRFWDCSRRDWSAPKPKEVENWFRDERGFPVKIADGAAQILRQSYKNWDQSKYENKKSNDELNMFDAVLLIAGRWKNADLGHGDRADQIDTYPDRQEMVELLKTRYGFADHVALVAWRIAKPDGAKSIGRPKEHDDMV